MRIMRSRYTPQGAFQKPFSTTKKTFLNGLLWLAVLGLILFSVLETQAIVKYRWETTAASTIRTQQGDCAQGEVCKELCSINLVTSDHWEGTGDFQCFPEY